VGILNSRLFNYLYRHISQETEGRAFAQVKILTSKSFLCSTAIKRSDRIVEIVDRILAEHSKGKDIGALESEIDQQVYALYGLTKEEIVIVEGVGHE